MPAADTRARLIEVAARHFAEHGLRGASQREIQRELGMNPATAHYYFGSKEALYRGVIDSFIHDVQEERLRRLEDVDPKLTGHDRLQRLLYDYFYPHVALSSTPAGYAYARILATVQHDRNTASTKIFDDIVAPVRRRYVSAIAELFPHTPRVEIQRLLAMGVALMAVTATWQDPSPQASEDAVRELACDLARYATAGFEAQLGKLPQAAVRKRKRAGRKDTR
jgi:AcrR family transcriptional regulator